MGKPAGKNGAKAPTCPECGARMNLRTPRNGQRFTPYWSCTRFPDCPGKLPADNPPKIQPSV